MATRRQRYDDLNRKGHDRSTGEEGEYQDLTKELQENNNRFLDEAGHDPESDNPAVPQTTTQEVAQSGTVDPNNVTGEPALKPGKESVKNRTNKSK